MMAESCKELGIPFIIEVMHGTAHSGEATLSMLYACASDHHASVTWTCASCCRKNTTLETGSFDVD